jgi:hypothetical protein
MLTKKFIQLCCYAAIASVLCFSGFGQISSSTYPFQSNSLLDISDLRPSVPNQFIRQVFLRDSTYTYSAIPGVEDEWVLESRAVNAYDNQGRRTGITRSDRVLENWQPKERILNAFSDANQVSVRQTLLWNDSLETWVNHEKRSFGYNPFGFEDEVVIQNWNAAAWEHSERLLKSYNLSDQLETTIQFIWEDSAEEWVENTRTLYSYNQRDLVEQMIVQVWSDSASTWLNYTRSTFVYDGDERVVLSTNGIWDAQADGFTESSFVEVIYNEKGQVASTRQVSLTGLQQQALITETANYDNEGNLDDVLQTVWDDENQAWENYKRHEHFWSKRYVGNIQNSAKEVTCVYANPYQIGQPWFCDALKKDVVYAIEVYDLLGRSYYRSYFTGGYSFRIENYIPPGIYVVVLRGGLDLHTEKVVIE